MSETRPGPRPDPVRAMCTLEDVSPFETDGSLNPPSGAGLWTDGEQIPHSCVSLFDPDTIFSV